MNVIKNIFLTVLLSLFLISNSNADKIKIGTEGDYPPWNSKDASGKLIGFEVELAWTLCRYIGQQCEIVEQDWDGMIPALTSALSGKTVCTQIGTIHQNFLESGDVGKINLKTYKTQDEVNLDLSNGRCDVALAAAVAFTDYAEKSGEAVVLVGPTFSGGAFGNGVGVGIRKDDTKLLKAFNKAIDKARKDGHISRIAIKWFGFDASM